MLLLDIGDSEIDPKGEKEVKGVKKVEEKEEAEEEEEEEKEEEEGRGQGEIEENDMEYNLASGQSTPIYSA